MNIVLAIQSLEFGGAERQIVELAAGLKEKGHDVSICCLNSLGPLAEEAKARGLTVDCLWKKRHIDPIIILRFVKYLKEKKTDVLQTFLFGADIWGRLAGKLAGTKVILTSDRLGGKFQDRKELWAVRLLWPLSDGIICNSNIGRDTILKVSKIPPSKVHVVFNGFSLTKFDQNINVDDLKKDLGITKSSYIVTLIATINPRKNQKMLLLAAQFLVNVDPSFKFIIVGDGPDYRTLDLLVKNRQLGEYVKMLGARADIPKILAASHVGVLCSYWEGFPNAIMEYMAMGLPVITTDVGGVRDLVQPDVTGFIIRPNDHKTLAEKILWLRENLDKAKAMGLAGRNWISNNCDFTVLADKTESIYKSILLQKGVNV